MQNFLVVSYDNDEQQWFYDTVREASAENAAALICKLRPYVIAADATPATELGKMAKRVKSKKANEINSYLDAIAVESGFEARCQNCESLYKLDDLEDIRHYHERVGVGEVVPAGQCPAADCGALCHLIPGAE